MIDPAGLLALVGVLAPIFALIGLGFGLGRSGVFSPEQVRGLSRFVLMAALPALLLNALARSHMAQVFRLDYLAVYGGASLLSYALGFAWFRGSGESVARCAVRAMGMANSNSAFIGLPVATLVFGPAAAGPVALNLLMENLVLFPLVLILIEIGHSGEHHPARVAVNVARGLVRTPMLIAILLGVLLSLGGDRPARAGRPDAGPFGGGFGAAGAGHDRGEPCGRKPAWAARGDHGHRGGQARGPSAAGPGDAGAGADCRSGVPQRRDSVFSPADAVDLSGHRPAQRRRGNVQRGAAGDDGAFVRDAAGGDGHAGGDALGLPLTAARS